MEKNNIKFPSPVINPELVVKPKIKNKAPIPPTILLMNINFLRGISFSCNCMKSAVIVALITKATNKEENSTTESVIGK